MPFTDPMADGPAIQAAGQRALSGGIKLRQILDMVATFRESDPDTPLILMGYYNPIYTYGVDRFLADFKAAGADGLIVVDLPPEEDAELCLPALAAGVNFIRLATPTTDDARLPAVLANTSGFVYYVSIAGITGTRAVVSADVTPAVERLKRHTDLPIAVGFGIKTPEQAAEIARSADAAVVGSSLVDHVKANLDADGKAGPELVDRLLGFVGELAEGVRHARKRRLNMIALPTAARRPMNWITNFVRPKIRALVTKTEVPDNLWEKCPSCQAMIFHRELKANQKVCPHCGNHMRIGPGRASRGDVRRGATTKSSSCRRPPADPLKFRDSKRYTDRLKEAASKTGEKEAIMVAHGPDGRPAHGRRRLQFPLHGRLHGRGGRRRPAGRGQAGGTAGGPADRGAGLGRSAHAGGHPLADADAPHGHRHRPRQGSRPALHRPADRPHHRRRFRPPLPCWATSR